MNTELWLCLTVAFAGLWSGLLLTITTILHPMFAHQELRGFVSDLSRFLPVARTSPTNYICVVGLVVAPAITLLAFDDRSSGSFVLTATGLALTVVGAFGFSRFLAEPNYDQILGWDGTRPTSDLMVARRRYFALNWLRGGFVWAAFVCFLVATYLHVA